VVILISLAALGAGNFPCCKPNEGDRVFRVFFRSARSHVLTKNYSVIASPVFALDAIMSVYGVYGHVAHLAAALKASRLAILRCNLARPAVSFLPHNQVDHHGDFYSPRECSDFRIVLWDNERICYSSRRSTANN
jgi:hypothetical protein